MRVEGWKWHTCNDWTRQGNKKQANTNIDIVIYKGIVEDDIHVEF